MRLHCCAFDISLRFVSACVASSRHAVPSVPTATAPADASVVRCRLCCSSRYAACPSARHYSALAAQNQHQRVPDLATSIRCRALVWSSQPASENMLKLTVIDWLIPSSPHGLRECSLASDGVTHRPPCWTTVRCPKPHFHLALSAFQASGSVAGASVKPTVGSSAPVPSFVSPSLSRVATAAAPGSPQPTSSAASSSIGGKMEVATLGGGCFWCIEACYNMMKGVQSAVSGYAAGQVDNPTYKQVGGAA